MRGSAGAATIDYHGVKRHQRQVLSGNRRRYRKCGRGFLTSWYSRKEPLLQGRLKRL